MQHDLTLNQLAKWPVSPHTRACISTHASIILTDHYSIDACNSIALAIVKQQYAPGSAI